MAVRADQLAIPNLFEHPPTVVPSSQIAEARVLDGSRQVIPLHGDRMKDLGAIGARLAFLQ
jgi:hypothetical protein